MRENEQAYDTARGFPPYVALPAGLRGEQRRRHPRWCYWGGWIPPEPSVVLLTEVRLTAKSSTRVMKGLECDRLFWEMGWTPFKSSSMIKNC